LNSKKFDISKLAIDTLKIALSIIPIEIKETSSIYLIVDDRILSKFGDYFDYYRLFTMLKKAIACM